jgi:hypothetical protein
MIYANGVNYPQNIAESSTITVPSEVPAVFMSPLVIILSSMLSPLYVIDLTGYDYTYMGTDLIIDGYRNIHQ